MTEDPQSHRERSRVPAEKESKAGRAFPLLAPTIIVAVALLIMLIFWLPQ